MLERVWRAVDIGLADFFLPFHFLSNYPISTIEVIEVAAILLLPVGEPNLYSFFSLKKTYSERKKKKKKKNFPNPYSIVDTITKFAFFFFFLHSQDTYILQTLTPFWFFLCQLLLQISAGVDLLNWYRLHVASVSNSSSKRRLLFYIHGTLL